MASTAVITFDCGSAPVNIVIERTLAIPADRDTVIDGANRVTLDGRGVARIMSLSQAGYRSNPHGLTLQRIRLVNGRAEGTPVRVLVRPDGVRLRPVTGATLTGTVLTHSFLGPVTRITVRLAGSTDLVRVDVPSDRAADHPPAAEVGLDIDASAAMLAALPA